MKPLLVGELNTKTKAPYMALWPPTTGTARRFCEILGITAEEYELMFDRINLCRGEWNWQTARLVAEILLRMSSYTQIVLFGRKVARAFGLQNFEAFSMIQEGETRMFLLPHPSGRCRVWNDGENIKRARKLMKQVIKKEIGKDAA